MWLHNLNPQRLQRRHTVGKVWAEAPSGWEGVWMRPALWYSTARVSAIVMNTKERRGIRWLGWGSWEWDLLRNEPSVMSCNTWCKVQNTTATVSTPLSRDTNSTTSTQDICCSTDQMPNSISHMEHTCSWLLFLWHETHCFIHFICRLKQEIHKKCVTYVALMGFDGTNSS